MFSANPESCYLLPFEAYPHLLGADWAGCIPSYLSFPSPSDHLPWVGAVTQHQLLRMACGGSFFWFPSQEPRAALLCAFWGWCIQEDTGGCRGSRRCEEHCSAVRFPRNSLWLLGWWGMQNSRTGRDLHPELLQILLALVQEVWEYHNIQTCHSSFLTTTVYSGLILLFTYTVWVARSGWKGL